VYEGGKEEEGKGKKKIRRVSLTFGERKMTMMMMMMMHLLDNLTAFLV
jgi:hypothetical protein